MDGSKGRMADRNCLEERKRLPPTDLPDYDEFRSLPQCCYQEVIEGDVTR